MSHTRGTSVDLPHEEPVAVTRQALVRATGTTTSIVGAVDPDAMMGLAGAGALDPEAVAATQRLTTSLTARTQEN